MIVSGRRFGRDTEIRFLVKRAAAAAAEAGIDVEVEEEQAHACYQGRTITALERLYKDMKASCPDEW